MLRQKPPTPRISLYLCPVKWTQVVGQQPIKDQLIQAVADGRAAQGYLFLGEEGSGVLPLALAFAREIMTRENPAAAHKIDTLNHLDLHFSFPVFSEKGHAQSKRFFPEFRRQILENPYFSLEDWGEALESANKQFLISTEEIEDQIQALSLKSFEGGAKVMIVFRADRMNINASNKLLKFLEEPPAGTHLILTAPSTDALLPTILSRVQHIDIPPIASADLLKALKEKPGATAAEEVAEKAQGDFNKALKLIKGKISPEFEELFIQWVRTAFQVKKRPEKLAEIIFWSRKVAAFNREKQKQFIEYAVDIFRFALMQNYGQPGLVHDRLQQENFNWEAFSSYIQGANIVEITQELSLADYHLQRNANAKIIWTDVGIKLSRYLHKAV